MEIPRRNSDSVFISSCCLRSILTNFTCIVSHAQVSAVEFYLQLATLQGVLDAPKARKEAYAVKAPHGKERNDDYYWLRDDDRQKPEVLDYLKVSLLMELETMSSMEYLSFDSSTRAFHH